MSKGRPDFINVRLSDAAMQELGEAGQVRFANAHTNYLFIGPSVVEVLRRPEWMMLQQVRLASGEPMFQEDAECCASTDHDSINSEA